MGTKARLAFCGLVLALAATAGLHNVSEAVTAEDTAFGERMLAEAGYTGPRRTFDLATFDGQIAAIRAVQDTAIRIAAKDDEVPFDRTREPKDVYELRRGLCYDRSRVIEKLLAVIGLETRHVSVYKTAARGALAAVLTPGNDSHALTEVQTSKGWIAVDPNVRWIGLTADGQALDVGGLRGVDLASVRWDGDGAVRPHAIFDEPYTFIRGLYSRHGRFYPPYTPIPDVNWRQLASNFAD